MVIKIKIMRNCEASMFVHSKTLYILQAAQIQYYKLYIKQLLGVINNYIGNLELDRSHISLKTPKQHLANINVFFLPLISND